jgi:hypothetical protein
MNKLLISLVEFTHLAILTRLVELEFPTQS